MCLDKKAKIAQIKQRILDEHRKHKDIDWAEIAAIKIYDAYLKADIDKSNRNIAYETSNIGKDNTYDIFDSGVETIAYAVKWEYLEELVKCLNSDLKYSEQDMDMAYDKGIKDGKNNKKVND